MMADPRSVDTRSADFWVNPIGEFTCVADLLTDPQKVWKNTHFLMNCTSTYLFHWQYYKIQNKQRCQLTNTLSNLFLVNWLAALFIPIA